MAAGTLLQAFHDVKGEASGDLYMQLAVLQDEAKKTNIINDFNRGCQHLLLVIHLKFAFYIEMPYRCAAMSHFNPDVAREAARDCLRQWDQLQRQQRTEGGAKPPHRVSKTLLHKASDLRPLVVLLAEGVPRLDPRLQP